MKPRVRGSTHFGRTALWVVATTFLLGAARSDDKAFEKLQVRRSEGNADKTLSDAESFLKAWKDGPNTAEAHHIAAEAAFQVSDWVRAHEHAEAALQAGDPAHNLTLRHIAAVALASGTNPKVAVPLLEGLVLQDDDLPRAAVAGRALIAVHERLNQGVSALAAFEFLFSRGLFRETEDLQAARRIRGICDEGARAAAADGRPGVAGLLHFLDLEAADQLRATPETLDARRAFAAAHPRHALLASVPEGGTLAKDVTAARLVVGVILPLTGKYAQPGELVRRGIAAGIAAAAARGQAVPELVVADSASDPARARSELLRLIDTEDVVAVLGPMIADEADQLAPLAEERGVPALMMVKKAGYGLGRRFVFNNWLLAEEQATTLAKYLRTDLLLDRVAIVYPEKEASAQLTDRFWAAFEAEGGAITGVEVFGQETTDFRGTARRLLGAEKAASAEAALPLLPNRVRPQVGRATVLLPGTDFQALFVPDGYKAVSMLAPGFLYEEVNLGGHLPQKNRPPVVLAGGSALNHPDLVTRAGKYVEGTTLVDVFFAGSPDPAVQAFVGAYRSEWKSEPTVLEAVGFDLATTVSLALGETGADRQQLAARLRTLVPSEVVASAAGFGPDGEMRHQARILRVSKGQFVQAWPPPPAEPAVPPAEVAP